VIEAVKHQAATEALRESEARLKALLSSLDDLVFELDENGTYLEIWTANDALLAVPRDELLGKTHREALGEEIGLSLSKVINKVLETDRPQFWEYRLEVPAGNRWFQGRVAPIAGSDGALRKLCLLVRDITEQKAAEQARDEAEEQLRHQALYDGLTGLPNRMLFHERVKHALQAARRNDQKLVLLMLDLDRFKEINDTLGHAAGDEVLREVAWRLSRMTRGSDSIARLGGDEFAILLPNASEADATAVVSRVSACLEEPIVVQDLPLRVDASIGLAAFPRDGGDADVLIRHADVAMYTAKAANGGFAAYESSTDPHTPDRLALIGELRDALEREELVLYYQPQMTLATGSVMAVEALIRWQHPQRGLVPPDEFIPLVQETGLIKPLTHYVLDRALRQCRSWTERGRPMKVAVNLAMRNLIDADLPCDVADLLELNGVSADRLVLEITESAVISDPLRTEAVLARLAKMGVRLSVDDFGTGYSSLTYLTRLPIDEIKIDRSFVTNMNSSADKEVIVRSTIDLARNLGKEVVAEGVETAGVLQRLEELGCHLVQGYYVSRPLPAGKLDAWLSESGKLPDAVANDDDGAVTPLAVLSSGALSPRDPEPRGG
jgi:diguanylate cyclase (GGDEF)-like protein/PAS domain S-box-containing protein